MEILEIKKSLMDIVGSLAQPNAKLENFVFNKFMAERKKNIQNLVERKKQYNALVWAKNNSDFDFRTCWHESIPFKKVEVFQLLMKLKEFYEVDEYELLTDDRKPKEGWEL